MKRLISSVKLSIQGMQEDISKVVKIDIWYDRYSRNWVVQKKDAEDNQIGDAIYVYRKEDALYAKKTIEDELGWTKKNL